MGFVCLLSLFFWSHVESAAANTRHRKNWQFPASWDWRAVTRKTWWGMSLGLQAHDSSQHSLQRSLLFLAVVWINKNVDCKDLRQFHRTQNEYVLFPSLLYCLNLPPFLKTPPSDLGREPCLLFFMANAEGTMTAVTDRWREISKTWSGKGPRVSSRQPYQAGCWADPLEEVWKFEVHRVSDGEELAVPRAQAGVHSAWDLSGTTQVPHFPISNPSAIGISDEWNMERSREL